MASFIERKIRKGGRIRPPDWIAEWYRSELDSLCRALFQADGEKVSREAIRHVFEKKAETLSDEFAHLCLWQSGGAYSKSMKGIRKSGDGLNPRSPKVAGEEGKIRKANADLIRSIPEVYFEKKDAAVERMGENTPDYERRVADIHRITYNRVRIIAQDQTNKASELLALARLETAGVSYVMWRHSGLPEKPRDYHKRRWDGSSGIRNGKPNGLNGFIFRIDNPPVIDLKTGERGYPSQLINCKCFLIPVVIK